MSRNGVCQTCGTIAPIEWFLSEADHRLLGGVLAEIPREIADYLWHYLALFKMESGKAMQVRKTLRLAGEIKELVTNGYVQVDNRVARPCPPRIWAQAMEQMIERRDRLTLPMPNHNYLRQIAWDMANKEDAANERGKPAAITRTRTTEGNPQPIQAMLDPMQQYIQGLRDDEPTPGEMQAWRRKQFAGDD